MNKDLTGAYGELMVGRYLRDRDYEIIDANYRCRLGEIDIIAADSKYICFVEVKTREVGTMLKPSDAVDYGKRKKIIASSQMFLSHFKTKLQPRFDVAEVYMENDKVSSINYIINAYNGEAK